MKTMSITIDEQLYGTLKRAAGPRGMSRFITHALQEKLRPKRQSLYREYVAAQKDKERQEVLRDWASLDTYDW
jgi:hypothetical protein